MAIARAGTEKQLLSYGVGDKRGPSSFGFMEDLQLWWRAYGPEIVARFGRCRWILLVMDAIEKLGGLEMTISRILRQKPQWDTTGWSAQEWTNIEHRAEAAYCWFAKHAPDPRDIPEWAQFVMVALDGAFGAMRKIAAEVREIQEEGHLLVSLTKPEDGTVNADQCVYKEQG